MSASRWASMGETDLRSLARAVLPELHRLIRSSTDAAALTEELLQALALPAGQAAQALEVALRRHRAVRRWVDRRVEDSVTRHWGRPTEMGGDGLVDAPLYRSYARVDAPHAVVVEEPFEVTIGLRPQRDRSLTSTGPVDLPEVVELDVLVTVDPDSLRLDGDNLLKLRLTAAEPYPSKTVTVTALDGDDLTEQRRIGVHYLLDGAVVAIAWRTLVAVATPAELGEIPRPRRAGEVLLDLAAVLIQEPPDLVLLVYRADSTRSGRYVWDAYPSAPGVSLPDTERAGDIGDPAELPVRIGREVAGSSNPLALYTYLRGTGRHIGDNIPAGIQQVIRTVAERPGLEQAPTVLLLTEEPYVPWELAVLSPTPATAFGGHSPFLGAHVAIGRWPLTATRPKPVPPRVVAVRDRAVLTARYEGVVGWRRLPHAEEEAAELTRRYPGTAVVEPRFDLVHNCLGGAPPADLLHVALHGQVDVQGREGLVLLAPRANGTFAPEFLKPQHVRGIDLARPTFVFLNACQVGQGAEVLGDYAGMAAEFLGAGASGVVAALWNVDDSAAKSFACDFYDAIDSGLGVGEALRRARASYTEDDRGSNATPMAYQLFGHPRVRLTTTGGGNHG